MVSELLNVHVDFAPFTVRVLALGSNDSRVPLTVCVTCVLAFAFAVEEEDDFTGWADVDFVVWAAAPETPTARARSEMLTATITFLIEDLLGRRPRLQCACHARRRWPEMCKWLPAHAVAARKPGMGGRARRAGPPPLGAPAARAATLRLTPGTGGAIVGRSGTAPGAPMTSWPDAPR